MPELPEVETVRRRLHPLVVGRRIGSVRILDPRLVRPADPRALERRLRGRTVTGLGRRGKYLLIGLDGDATLVSHLRMTGNWLVVDGVPTHARATFAVDEVGILVFADVRRFGTLDLMTGEEAAHYLAARLGPEPLDDSFDGTTLRRSLHGRRAPIKALLLDQRVVAGVGNIYADEALHRAGIHPDRPAGRLTAAQCDALAVALRTSLEVGIAQQGASIRDFRDPAGGYGSMQESFRVYGRDGEPCVECGTTIVKTRSAGRGTHVCLRCQPRPRRRHVREWPGHDAR